jgi:hypothetical protein
VGLVIRYGVLSDGSGLRAGMFAEEY